jgi:hypothetical protein
MTSSIDPSFQTTPKDAAQPRWRTRLEIIFKQLGVNSIKVCRAPVAVVEPAARSHNHRGRANMIDLRNKEMGRMLSRELQAHFAVVGGDLPIHLSELLDRLIESEGTPPPADLADNSSSEQTCGPTGCRCRKCFKSNHPTLKNG